MVSPGEETPAPPTPPDFGQKIRQVIDFISGFSVEAAPDLPANIPGAKREAESRVSFSAEDLEKIEKNLKSSQVTTGILWEHLQKNTAARIQGDFLTNVRQFNLLPTQWKKCVIDAPQLFYLSPETIKRNIEEAANLLGLAKETYIKAALKQPSLFTRSPETMAVKLDLYDMFVNMEKQEILKSLLKNPQWFTYAPERIMAFYVLFKLSGIRIDSLNVFNKKLLSFAKQILEPNEYENAFRPLYDYFKHLFERRRKIKRKVTKSVEKEAGTTLRQAQKVLEYFGPKEQLGLTEEEKRRVLELVSRVKEKIQTKR